jgi:subtilisin family serine protease
LIDFYCFYLTIFLIITALFLNLINKSDFFHSLFKGIFASFKQKLMKKFFILCAIIIIQLSSIAQEKYISNQIIVMMNGAQNVEQICIDLNQNWTNINIHPAQTLSKRAHIYLLEFDDQKTSVPHLVRQLKTDDRITFVQPNHTNIKQRDTTPNDLEYPVQWSMGNTKTARIYAPQAWDISTDDVTLTGDTIVMAVIDGGVDTNHIDLNLFKNKHEIPNNGIDDDQNGYIDDYHGWNAFNQSDDLPSDSHGTHIAGIMGAKTNNSEGVAGIVWGGKILPVRGSSSVESIVLEAYGYVLELREKYNESNGDSGAFIVASNSSFGVDMADPADYPIWCAFYDTLGEAGILNLAATSNSGVNVDVDGDIPTTCPSNYMVAVSNVNSSGQVLGGYGATQIDLAAPGTDIRSTTPGHNYGFKTGTSMATPHVAGVVGAMYSAMCGFDLQNALDNRPDSLALWVRKSLLESVDSVPNLIGKNITNGRLNMFKALKKVQYAPVQINYTITPASSSSSNDGSITTNISGGTAPYSYVWNTGATTPDLAQINQGIYTLTVTEQLGCFQSDSIHVWIVGINDLENKDIIQISPNPNNGNFQINWERLVIDEPQVSIYDATGRLVFTTKIENAVTSTEINANLKSGVYFIQINNSTPSKMIIK